jgi:membrane-associated phospholipid phosphatase
VIWPGLQGEWFRQVNRFAGSTPALHPAIRLYAQYGVVVFAGILLLGWWWARRDTNRRTMAAALWAPVGMLIAVGLNQPLVNHVREARPYTVYPHALVLVARSQDYSFPSDHAVMAGAVAAGVLLVNRRLGAVAVVAALLMACARVYVGAHFPLDVVAGLLLGAIVTISGYLAVRPLLVPIVTGLTRTPLRPLLTTSPRSAA